MSKYSWIYTYCSTIDTVMSWKEDTEADIVQNNMDSEDTRVDLEEATETSEHAPWGQKNHMMTWSHCAAHMFCSHPQSSQTGNIKANWWPRPQRLCHICLRKTAECLFTSWNKINKEIKFYLVWFCEPARPVTSWELAQKNNSFNNQTSPIYIVMTLTNLCYASSSKQQMFSHAER